MDNEVILPKLSGSEVREHFDKSNELSDVR